MRAFPLTAIATTVLLCAGWSGQSAPGPAGGASSPPQPAAVTSARQDDRASKQKVLQEEAQQLVDMATELKVNVDKTNKNILSLDVVRKAEEIEALAHRMKEQARK